MAKCFANNFGCFTLGSTTQWISAIGGGDDRYYVNYGPTAQAAINAALSKAGNDAGMGTHQSHCAWDVS
jgi:hypothetical protein